MSLFPRDALCVGADPELWFPIGVPGSPGYEALAAPARALCALCPVARECVEWAIRTGSNDGIFGGLDPVERRRVAALIAV